jgi:hypothetical protein
VAILLSGPTQVIFSSPIAHARAMRAIRTRLTHLTSSDSVSDAQKALDRALGADFAFLPHNHWHHWHVHYNEPRGDPMSAAAGIERVRGFLDLWATLGVDLEPFTTHLQNLELRPPPRAERARVEQERAGLANLIAHNYTPSADGRARLHGLFRAFDAGEPLNEPAEGVPFSEGIRAAVAATEEVRLAAEIDNFLATFGAYRQLIESLDPYITAPAPPP